MELVYFENSYWEDYSVNKEEDALASIYIDGYPYDENAEGQVVAKVWITQHKDIFVDWHHNGYRMNETVLELIEESKKKLKEEYCKQNNDLIDKGKLKYEENYQY